MRIPLLFISGVFTPIGQLPVWMQAVSFLSPLTHTVGLASYASGGETFFGPVLNVIVLGAYAAVFVIVSIHFNIMNQRKQ